ncbi:hypothetical protein [Flavivirga jejuensis]|uniref:Uncharacterized protein n=1 Tax=Flavivirga jejuensis TaxID=870487 RepID=A0ABT8WRR1_9FLAO|nr:hypothetical protein [Flavivirga jejuensis]MDO5975596.1 hypothetical protein [Flavivirga jejuensis]
MKNKKLTTIIYIILGTITGLLISWKSTSIYLIMLFVVLPICGGLITYKYFSHRKMFWYLISAFSIGDIVGLLILTELLEEFFVISWDDDLLLTILGIIFIISKLLLFVLISYFLLRVSGLISSKAKTKFTNKEEEEKLKINVTENTNSELDRLISNIEDQSGQIQNILKSLKKEAENKNEEIKRLKLAEIELKKRVSDYEELSSFSEEKLEIISKQLNKDKYKDYVMGFVIGCASSFIMTLIIKKLGL